jgi:hypothetical protein
MIELPNYQKDNRPEQDAEQHHNDKAPKAALSISAIIVVEIFWRFCIRGNHRRIVI